MTNKVGFTEEQQLQLASVIGIATRVARCVTESRTGTAETEAAEMLALHRYIRDTWPDGPWSFKDTLEEIVRFCDLPLIITAKVDTDPKV